MNLDPMTAQGSVTRQRAILTVAGLTSRFVHVSMALGSLRGPFLYVFLLNFVPLKKYNAQICHGCFEL